MDAKQDRARERSRPGPGCIDHPRRWPSQLGSTRAGVPTVIASAPSVIAVAGAHACSQAWVNCRNGRQDGNRNEPTCEMIVGRRAGLRLEVIVVGDVQPDRAERERHDPSLGAGVAGGAGKKGADGGAADGSAARSLSCTEGLRTEAMPKSKPAGVRACGSHRAVSDVSSEGDLARDRQAPRR